MYGVSITITHAGKSGEAEVDQAARFTGWTSSNRGLEMDCIGTFFHEHLISKRPSQPDQQVGGDSAHDPVDANPPWTKCVAQSHNYQDDQPRHLQCRIPAQVPERRIEF